MYFFSIRNSSFDGEEHLKKLLCVRGQYRSFTFNFCFAKLTVSIAQRTICVSI